MINFVGILQIIRQMLPNAKNLMKTANKKGYEEGNIAFVCREFNTSEYSLHTRRPITGTQRWSREKVQRLPEKVYESLEAFSYLLVC